MGKKKEKQQDYRQTAQKNKAGWQKNKIGPQNQ